MGPDGKELIPQESPRVGGFGFVATPSPAPGEKLSCWQAGLPVGWRGGRWAAQWALVILVILGTHIGSAPYLV